MRNRTESAKKTYLVSVLKKRLAISVLKLLDGSAATGATLGSLGVVDFKPIPGFLFAARLPTVKNCGSYEATLPVDETMPRMQQITAIEKRRGWLK